MTMKHTPGMKALGEMLHAAEGEVEELYGFGITAFEEAVLWRVRASAVADIDCDGPRSDAILSIPNAATYPLRVIDRPTLLAVMGSQGFEHVYLVEPKGSALRMLTARWLSHRQLLAPDALIVFDFDDGLSVVHTSLDQGDHPDIAFMEIMRAWQHVIATAVGNMVLAREQEGKYDDEEDEEAAADEPEPESPTCH